MKKAKFLHLSVLLAAIFFSCKEKDKELVLKTETISATTPEQIVTIEDSLVRPILYQHVPSLENLPVTESKEKFIGAVLPAILISKHYIKKDRERIQELSQKEEWSMEDSLFYLETRDRFGAKDIIGLLTRMKTHPNSIVLAQAAVESGWGQSRFFQEGNNLFGIWSYNSNEPRMEASLTRGETEVHLRKYEDISSSVTDYFETIGRSRPYWNFRKARLETNKVSKLLPHLKHYSERRMEYVEQLQTMIRQNDLTVYDHYQIDPQYFVEK